MVVQLNLARAKHAPGTRLPHNSQFATHTYCSQLCLPAKRALSPIVLSVSVAAVFDDFDCTNNTLQITAISKSASSNQQVLHRREVLMLPSVAGVACQHALQLLRPG